MDAYARLGVRLKVCTACKQTKELAAFSKNSGQKSGLEPSCKACRKVYHAEFYKLNKERYAKNSREWIKRNPAASRVYSRRYRERYPGIAAKQTRKWREDNPMYGAIQTARRRASKRRAIPKWADRRAILYHYKRAAFLTKERGFKYCVDHIVPLSSPLVCGLHVQDNLRVIPSGLNLLKSNRSWPDMP